MKIENKFYLVLVLIIIVLFSWFIGVIFKSNSLLEFTDGNKCLLNIAREFCDSVDSDIAYHNFKTYGYICSHTMRMFKFNFDTWGCKFECKERIFEDPHVVNKRFGKITIFKYVEEELKECDLK